MSLFHFHIWEHRVYYYPFRDAAPVKAVVQKKICRVCREEVIYMHYVAERHFLEAKLSDCIHLTCRWCNWTGGGDEAELNDRGPVCPRCEENSLECIKA